jgi:uncharacterized protein (TIGR03067 family)
MQSVQGIAAMCVLFVGSGAKADTAHKLEKFQGAWTVLSWTEDLKDETARIESVAFAGGKVTIKLRGGKKDVEGTCEVIDAEKKTIKLRLRQEVLGIYEFGNNTLKLCLAEPRQEPPKEFKATLDSTLIVLKRQGD